MSIPNTYKELANGKFVDIANPSTENLDIETLFKQLSLINRFNGATYPNTVSVLEHSINVSLMLKHWGFGDFHQLYGLVHDAHEAIIGDISTPVKNVIDISSIDDKWYDVILDLASRDTGLSIRMIRGNYYNQVFLVAKEADAIVTRFEAIELMPSRAKEWGDIDTDKDLLIEYVEFNKYRYGSNNMIELCGCGRDYGGLVGAAMKMYESFIDPTYKIIQEVSPIK